MLKDKESPNSYKNLKLILKNTLKALKISPLLFTPKKGMGIYFQDLKVYTIEINQFKVLKLSNK